MIRITARMSGFRRCGVAHVGTKDYADDFWTDEQLEILKSDPMLLVEEIPGEGGESRVTPRAAPEGNAPQGDAPQGNTPGAAAETVPQAEEPAPEASPAPETPPAPAATNTNKKTAPKAKKK